MKTYAAKNLSPEDHKRALLDLSHQLASGDDLTDSQKQYLAIVFYRIATGEDANKVLGVRLERGVKKTDLVARRRMSFILHWVACAMYPDPQTDKQAMTLTQACEAAISAIVPLAKKKFPGADHHTYDVEYIERCWSEPTYAHMRSTQRRWFDPDYPYYDISKLQVPK